MRVLMVLDSLQLGGAERNVVDLSLALRRRGHEVTVACSAGGPFEDHLRGEVPVRVLMRAEVKRKVSPTYAWQLRRMVAEGFDVIHAHMFASAVAGATLRLPLVITEHSEARWQGKRERVMNGWACRRAGAVIAASRPIGRRVERLGVRRERLHVLPNAAPPGPSSNGDGGTIAVIARLVPEKGVECLLDCLPDVVNSVPDAHLVIIGDGPLRGALEARARAMGFVDRVVFTGAVDGRPLLPSMAVLAVPSLTEGTPLAMLEAMAAGIPVVAAAVGGIPDQMRHGVEGLLVKPGDARDMAVALIRLLRDGDERRRMGEAGRQRTGRATHEAMVSRVERVYDGVVAGRRERAVETVVQTTL